MRHRRTRPCRPKTNGPPAASPRRSPRARPGPRQPGPASRHGGANGPRRCPVATPAADLHSCRDGASATATGDRMPAAKVAFRRPSASRPPEQPDQNSRLAVSLSPGSTGPRPRPSLLAHGARPHIRSSPLRSGGRRRMPSAGDAVICCDWLAAVGDGVLSRVCRARRHPARMVLAVG
jgi:hypothetical protein